MEISLNLDDELLVRLRAQAEQRQTTLDEWIVEQLWRASGRAEQIEAWARRTRERGGHPGPGYRFRRDDAYDGPLAR